MTASNNVTSKEYSIVLMEAVAVYARNHERNVLKYIQSLDQYDYYMMNIVDYLVGNTGRHFIFMMIWTERTARRCSAKGWNC